MSGEIFVKIHPSENGGFWAEAESLPGCVTEGDSLDEIKSRISEAVEAWLGEPAPASSIRLDIPVSNLAQ